MLSDVTYEKSVADDSQCQVNCSLGCAGLHAEISEECGGGVRYVHMIRKSMNDAVDLQNNMLPP